ncbi:stage II sporulation protein R [Heliorestis convoluta]|uniref:Stage II sporulation protein R n=1 Tax=Heliorestis convoluta TaxID=356322 RepID=A0A5Q2N364_9FIRM|nr:stage II sporulation protein R [Heliorestis convoluta]QGG47015.1 stage II sporulation protein R [Heliorestis convoluta]
MLSQQIAPTFRLLTLSTLLLLFCLTVAYYLPHIEARTEDPLPLLRLHVVAPSNEEHDQNLKLQVRDDIITYIDPLLAESHSIEEAREKVQAHLDEITEIAKKRIQEEGYSYSAAAEVGRFHFPKKVYGHLSAPAGEYEALRILIGTGQGDNWWCVLYPPLCLNDRIGTQKTESQDNIEQKSTLSQASPKEEQTIEVRSKFWDWIRSLIEKIKKTSKPS